MGKIKPNEEGQHPPSQFFAAVTLLLILTATRKWALPWGSISQQNFPEQGHALHVAQEHRGPAAKQPARALAKALGEEALESEVEDHSTGDTR